MPEAAAERAPRVAVVLTQLGFGGAEKQTWELLRRLAGRAEAPALVACLSDDLEPYGPRLREAGYRLEVLSRGRSFDLARLLRLRRLLLAERIELVHAVHMLASGYCALATLGGRRPRLLPSARGTVVPRHPLRSRVYRWMLGRSPRVLANSERGGRFLVDELGAREESLVVVPNGLDFAALRARANRNAGRESLGVAAEVPLVGYVGKDNRVKNVPRFLRILRTLLEARPDAVAYLAGVRLDEGARARLAPDLPPKRVHFLGPRDDIPSLLAAADVNVLTSESEGCPNTVLEALGVGTPVVSGNVGDVDSMSGGGAAGTVVPVDDEGAYARACLEWIERGETGRAAVRARWPALDESYGMDAMVRRTVELWREVATL